MIYMLLVCLSMTHAQKSFAEMERDITELSGTEKLVAYHSLVELYLSAGESKKALKAALKAD